MEKNIQWILELKEMVPKFLERMKGKSQPGFFCYSMTGDLASEQVHWGLGNTVFATKIYYTLGLLDILSSSERKNIVDYIKSFQTSDGFFFDPLVARNAFWREKVASIKQCDFNNFFHTQTIRAETRQALSALVLLGEKVYQNPNNLPKTEAEIETWLSKLDWTKPWGAGSHFSHLLFFLSHSDLEEKESLITHTIKWVNKKLNQETGSWYDGRPSLQQQINGAMKVLTGFQAVDRTWSADPKKLIDLALKVQNDKQACDQFNVVYVLKQASCKEGSTYRQEEIFQFAHDRIVQYQKYYWPEYGGFSYFLGKANDVYYNARISRGLHEPDIHGTTLFLWGIAIIAKLIGKDQELGFKEFVT